MRRLIRFIINTAVFLFVVVNAMAAFHAWRFTHFYTEGVEPIEPDKLSLTEKISAVALGVKVPKSVIVDTLPIAHDTVFLATKDNLVIDGWYARHTKPKGSVALFHGHVATKAAVINEALAFYKMGYSVLLIDFRGHGNSGGDQCTIGYKEAEEVELAYSFLKEAGSKKIILWGVSMGAAAITSAFDKHPDMKPDGVILELPFGSLKQAVITRTKIMGIPGEPVSSLLTFWGGIENGFNAFSLKPAEYAKQINCPVLLQAGALDNKVSLKEIDAIYSNILTEKKKVVYETATHESLYRKEPELWKQSVKGFLKTLN